MAVGLQLFDLSGKVVLVAGASRGIGFSVAKGLADAGASVFSCGRSSAPAESHSGVWYRQCDLNHDDSVESLCRLAASVTGRIDVLAFVAAVTAPVSDQMQTVAEFSNTLNTNVIAAYRLVRYADPWLTSGGSVIFFTSINSALGFPDNPAYVASKGGLRQLCRALAVDFGTRGIRVNAIAPGYVRTQMTEMSYLDEGKRTARERRTILGRWGEPGDLIGPTIFLASSASAYLTGQEIFVDGGWTAKGL